MKLITIILTAALAVPPLTSCAVPESGAAAPPAASGEAQQPSEATGTGPAKAEHWVTVATLAGSGNKRGASFHLGDGDKQLVYTVRTNDPFVFAAYVVPKGDSLKTDGGIPEVTAEKPGRDSTRLAQDAGDYYVEVMAANARWSVKVQEKR